MNTEPNENDFTNANDGIGESNGAMGTDENQTIEAETENFQAPETTVEKPENPVQSQKPSDHHTNKAVWIVMIVFALLIGGGLGYIFGNNFATVNNSERDALEQQVKNLESDLADANDKLDEATSDTTDADKITELERENASLQQKVNDLEDQVAELEQQLEDAQSPSTNSSTES